MDRPINMGVISVPAAINRLNRVIAFMTYPYAANNLRMNNGMTISALDR